MRKMMLLAVMVALAAMMLAAAPAMAADRDGDGHDDDFCDKNDEFCEDFEKDFCFFFDCGFDEFFEEFCEDFDGDLICDFDEGAFFADGITQETEQEAESGDIDQSFDVSQTGDNSNQCVGVQGVANTGNAQNTINVFNLGGEDAEFEFDEVGSTIDVSPINTTTCDQEVNQAAAAYGGDGGGHYLW
jgi:hypothetical protein